MSRRQVSTAKGGDAVARLLIDLSVSNESTLIVVSHDPRLTGRLERRITLSCRADRVGSRAPGESGMTRFILSDLRRLWAGSLVVVLLIAFATALGVAVTLQERARPARQRPCR